ncbi:tetratricopeptide repeat protein [Streptomyces sviceus]|uniref:tetratricopeptide repeat protein n=1 Tax=Streptomyces sviceus TaxID=285530 RepID=UPI0036CE69DB
MKRNLLDAYASILSIPPIFDEALALEFGTNPQFKIARSEAEALRLLTELKMCGAIVRERYTCWRISESLRSELQRDFQNDRMEDYPTVVQMYLRHAGFSGKFQGVLGLSASEITKAVLQLSVSGSRADLNKLVGIVKDGARKGRGADARCTMALLSQLPPYPDQKRQQEFFYALWLWRHRDRSAATRSLNEVIKHPQQDLASAISAHLLAVVDIDEGSEFKAIPLLQRSLSDLEVIDDRRGTALVLTTLGRAQREIAARSKARAGDLRIDPSKRFEYEKSAMEYFASAHDSFEEARELASALGEKTSSASAALELAICYEREGDIDAAIIAAEEARQEVPTEDQETMARILTLLGSLYRKREDYSASASALDEAFKYLTEPTLELAKLLNVLASTERKMGNLPQARQHAEHSVSIGRRLRNVRHIAHALCTLASVAIDLAQSYEELDFAASCMDEAGNILEELHDIRGLSYVASLRKASEKKRRELGFEGAP